MFVQTDLADRLPNAPARIAFVRSIGPIRRCVTTMPCRGIPPNEPAASRSVWGATIRPGREPGAAYAGLIGGPTRERTGNALSVGPPG